MEKEKIITICIKAIKHISLENKGGTSYIKPSYISDVVKSKLEIGIGPTVIARYLPEIALQGNWEIQKIGKCKRVIVPKTINEN